MHKMRVSAAAVIFAASVAMASGQGKPAASVPADLDGTWKLNRELSQFPRDLGFGMDVVGGGKTTITDPGRSGGGESSSPGLAIGRPASREEAENSRQLVDEVRNPPAQLTVARNAGAVIVTDDRGRSRTYHPDGREAFTPLDAAPVATVSRWDAAGRLVIRYKVEPGREVRYTVSRRVDPPQLVVQAELLERGGRDSVVRVYEPARADETAPAPERTPPQAPPVLTLPSQRPAAAQPPQAPAEGARPGIPAVPAAAPAAPAPPDLDQRPGAELKGLSSLGVVVEELGSEAVACGVNRDALETAAAKSLSAAGLRVIRDTDEDTYLYINVVTTSTPSGYCFSRYDAYVYSYTTATLSYGSRPALVQVSLMHKGGVAGSGLKGHGDAVIRTVTQYVDQFAAQIRNANR